MLGDVGQRKKRIVEVADAEIVNDDDNNNNNLEVTKWPCKWKGSNQVNEMGYCATVLLYLVPKVLGTTREPRLQQHCPATGSYRLGMPLGASMGRI